MTCHPHQKHITCCALALSDISDWQLADSPWPSRPLRESNLSFRNGTRWNVPPSELGAAFDLDQHVPHLVRDLIEPIHERGLLPGSDRLCSVLHRHKFTGNTPFSATAASSVSFTTGAFSPTVFFRQGCLCHHRLQCGFRPAVIVHATKVSFRVVCSCVVSSSNVSQPTRKRTPSMVRTSNIPIS